MSDEKQEKLYIDLSDKDALEQAQGNVNHYGGIMSASAAHRRSYLDIEDGISVRTSFDRGDYYNFRPNEAPPVKQKGIISKCMNAYDKVGIIKNVIDLMGDFGSQGITVVHPDINAQKFYRRWWEQVGGAERSERFLNTLFRCGNVVVKRRHARLNKKTQKEMSRGEEDVIITKENVSRRRIPYIYDFLNPLSIEVVGGQSALFTGDKKYRMKISRKIKKALEAREITARSLPEDIRKALSKDKNYIDLDPENLMVYHYKKDDWQLWAYPMVNAILDDITMLEKMKLADMSALDGAISNIRLWTLGDFEHQVLPTSNGIDKLKNVLASNIGGGTMDLVWGPELDFKESNTQIYKFLGTEKYQPVLNSIYAGLGIPPTLTGIAGNGGGYTNNFISLKTLIERLEYGRDLLSHFWNNELRRVQKAMGFAKPAKLHFDHMILSDESAEKSLLVQLADRDIVSVETVRERFGELNDIEDSRIKKESKKRDRKAAPPKAGPYHNSQIEEEYKKIALNKDQISIDQVTDLEPKEPEPEESVNDKPQEKKKNDSENPEGGRPKNSFDKQTRKRKVVNPRTNADILIWATSAYKKLSDLLQPSFLQAYGKSNVRKLTKSEADQLELSKFCVFTTIAPFSEINEELILKKSESKLQVDQEIMSRAKKISDDFIISNERSATVDELRQIYCLAYTEVKSAYS